MNWCRLGWAPLAGAQPLAPGGWLRAPTPGGWTCTIVVDIEDGYNFRGEDGWCEPRGLPMELRETIKKHPTMTTSDARRPSRRKFLLRLPVFGRAYHANVLQVTILINLQFGPADVFRCVCLHPRMPAGASLNRRPAHTHPTPTCAFSAGPTERQ
jgi:hypothetical protein